MSAFRTFQVAPDTNIHEITQVAARHLTQQGYYCCPQPIGPQATALIVAKDRDGIQNFAGLGVECRVSLTINGNQLQVSIESEWTNKIIAIVLGLCICWITLVTGIVGSLNQNSLPDKIFTAIGMAVSSFGGAPFQQPPYQAPYQPPYQPPYQAPQHYQPPENPQSPRM